MIFRRIRHVKRDNSGVAMITAMIVGIVVMVFCLSLLLVTYTLYAQAIKETTNEQCKVLAQSFSETLGVELKDSDSELNKYLSDQMKSGCWVPKGMLGDGSGYPTGSVEEIIVDMDNADELGDYHMTLFFSYHINIPEDDDEDEGNEDDDQDDDNTGGSSGGTAPGTTTPGGTTPGEPAANTYAISAKIQCYRGDMDDKDTPVYLDVDYANIALK